MLRRGWDLGGFFNSTLGDFKVSVIQMDNKVVMVNGCNINTQIEFFLLSLGNVGIKICVIINQSIPFSFPNLI